MTTTENPQVTIPGDVLPSPIVDVPTPDNWVILVRQVGRRYPSQAGKFVAEYWSARPTGDEADPMDGGDVAEGPDRPDGDIHAFEALLKSHHDVMDGEHPAFFDSVEDAAIAAVAAARARGALIDHALDEYIMHLAKTADGLRPGVPTWGDLVFKRDALEAMRSIGATDANVRFIETDQARRQVDVDLIYRGAHYEVSYTTGEHDQELQDVILRAIMDLPVRARAEQAEAAAAKPAG